MKLERMREKGMSDREREKVCERERESERFECSVRFLVKCSIKVRTKSIPQLTVQAKSL